ncbi:MAG: helix-turn-helix domain-containing protein [Elusimicrobiaceae bacterium]|nr:helix-turn-helix domain-containing protein [Elusimicrobiaceae bacterium]
MIDTVALKIDKYLDGSYGSIAWEVEQPDLFSNIDVASFSGSNWHKWNKRGQEKRLQDYYPHVEIWNFSGYKSCYCLFVRFSVPKLIYGNNLLEVTDAQFNTVCQMLQTKLQTMGIKVDINAIRAASVNKVHYGKNIICYGVPVELVLTRLVAAKPCIAGMDVQKTIFRNGRQFSFHNKTREVCFYDKRQEVLQYHRKDTKLEWLFKRPDLKNILRIEVRLNKKTSFKRHFKSTDLTFQDVFSEQKAKEIITDYWDTIYKSVQFIPPMCYAPEYQLLAGPVTGVLERDLELLGLRSVVNSMGYAAAYKLMSALYPKDKMPALFGKLQKNVPSLVLPAEYDVLRMIDAELKQFKWLGKHSWGLRQKLLRNKEPLTYQCLLTVKDAAKYAKVNERTLQKWLKEGRIGYFKIGNEYRLRKEDLFTLFCGKKIV